MAVKIRNSIQKFSDHFFAETLFPSFYTRLVIVLGYCFLHFGLGFFTLWLTYNHVVEGHAIGTSANWGINYGPAYPDLNEFQYDLRNHVWQNGFMYKSATETIYLILCVIWGSIGWDRIKSIFKDKSGMFFYRYFVLETCLMLSLLTIFSSAANIWLEFLKGVWWPNRFSNQSAFISILLFLGIFAGEIVRFLFIIPDKFRNIEGYRRAMRKKIQ